MSVLDELIEEVKQEKLKKKIWINGRYERVDINDLIKIVYTPEVRSALCDAESKAYEENTYVSTEFVGQPEGDYREYIYMKTTEVEFFVHYLEDKKIKRNLLRALQRKEVFVNED